MKTIDENNRLTIEQLEERLEMVVASKGSSDNSNPEEWVDIAV